MKLNNHANQISIKRRRITGLNVLKDTTHTCKNNCCNMKITSFAWSKKWVRDKCNSDYKAGIFIYDSSTSRILLVQSCGLLWGPPKGSIRKTETILQGAIREVEEETGLKIHPKLLKGKSPIYLKKNSYYFILDMKEEKVNVQNIPNNDANGITWINVKCLDALINKKGVYRMNKHSKVLINKIFNIKLINETIYK